MSDFQKLSEALTAAYAKNNIPMTPTAEKQIALLPVQTIKHLIDCWEKRAMGLDVNESYMDEYLTIQECKKILRNVRGRIAHGERYGQRRFLQTWREYHGS